MHESLSLSGVTKIEPSSLLVSFSLEMRPKKDDVESIT